MAITGDLTDNAQQADFEILRKMFRYYGLLQPDRLRRLINPEAA